MGKINENSAKSTKTKNVTPAVTPWGKNRVKNTETGKHVLIMPGIGYTVDRPLLYWSAQALAANGWFVDRLDLKLTESVEFPEMIACMERVVDEWRKAALEHAAESGEEPQLLVVTKSLSTLSYPHSAKLGLRVVLLTPVLNPPPFDKHKSVIPAPLPGAVGSPMPLICAGDADPYSMMPSASAHRPCAHVRWCRPFHRSAGRLADVARLPETGHASHRRLRRLKRPGRTMRIVLQKVGEGTVDVVDETSGEVDTTFEPQHIGIGYVLLVGVEDTDGAKQIDWLARKIANLRVFEDENGKMNRSIHDADGSVLSISQFTLYADVRKGNRPSFVKAGAPAHAEQIWNGFNDALRAQGLEVKEGRFGSHMRVRLANDGPVTIILDTDELGV